MDTSGHQGPLVVRTKARLTSERLEDDIVKGRRAPGSRIVLDEVALELGVSKIPVREALSSLESKGLVVQSPHSGPRVAPLSLREFRAVHLLREETEALVARLAAETISDEEIASMRRINEEMRDGLLGDPGRLTELNTTFHLSLARATTYEALVVAVTQSLRTVRRYRAIVRSLATNWDTAVTEHDLVLASLSSRDPAEVERVVRHHVGSQRELELTDAADPTL